MEQPCFPDVDVAFICIMVNGGGGSMGHFFFNLVLYSFPLKTFLYRDMFRE